ncbi:MAG: hypothetical protein HPY46_06140 [Candidatus Aminicenantes bacterium]|nr:hypothetical protein [Candidatus Aminicenantes bacterium]
MGKHERKLIQEAELILIKFLNNDYINDQERQNPWFHHSRLISKCIKKDFRNLKNIGHLGNKYDKVGDIFISDGVDKYYIELKMSKNPSGFGTKANISQDALTDLGLFEKNTKSWSMFRSEYNHDEKIINILDQYRNYPCRIKENQALKNRNKIKECKARYLRDKANNGDKNAHMILNEVHDFDKSIKIKYLNYLSCQQQNYELIKKFYILIMLGIHKIKIMKALMEKNDLLNNIGNLIIYYACGEYPNIEVLKENVIEKVRINLGNFATFRINFIPNVTYCQLVGTLNNKITPLLNIVLHWKNVSQGIKTPCLNIFDLTHNYLYSDRQ